MGAAAPPNPQGYSHVRQRHTAYPDSQAWGERSKRSNEGGKEGSRWRGGRGEEGEGGEGASRGLRQSSLLTELTSREVTRPIGDSAATAAAGLTA